MAPWDGLVDSLPIHSQPLTHLFQTLLKHGGYPSIMGRSYINQDISPTTVKN